MTDIALFKLIVALAIAILFGFIWFILTQDDKWDFEVNDKESK